MPARSAAATPKRSSTGPGASATRDPDKPNLPLPPRGRHGRRDHRPRHEHRHARQKRIEFKPEWFDIDSDETPEDVAPDVAKYA